MTPEVSDLIPGSLEGTDKYIEVADGHHVMAKKSSITNTNVRRSRKDIHLTIIQRTFSTRLMQQVILNCYVNFFDFSMIFPRNACFLCSLGGNVTAFFSFVPKYTVQNTL